MDSVTELWQRIDTWLHTFAPTRAALFGPGVTPEELAEAEETLGLTLPADFKASYRIHNGAESESGLLMGYSIFSPLSGVVSSPEAYKALLLDATWAAKVPYWVRYQQNLPVQPVWRHPSWLDFAARGDGDTWCIDLAPAPGGHIGQVLFWSHETSVGGVLFPSFEALLSAYADQLEAGLYLNCSPVIQLEKLTHLKERRAAFQQPSPAKSVLHQAIRSAWEHAQNIDESLDAFRQVLRMKAATPEDRFFAFYGLITWCVTEWGYDDEVPTLFAQLEREAQSMPTTHWVHEEVTLLKPWSIR